MIKEVLAYSEDQLFTLYSQEKSPVQPFYKQFAESLEQNNQSYAITAIQESMSLLDDEVRPHHLLKGLAKIVVNIGTEIVPVRSFVHAKMWTSNSDVISSPAQYTAKETYNVVFRYLERARDDGYLADFLTDPMEFLSPSLYNTPQQRKLTREALTKSLTDLKEYYKKKQKISCIEDARKRLKTTHLQDQAKTKSEQNIISFQRHE